MISKINNTILLCASLCLVDAMSLSTTLYAQGDIKLQDYLWKNVQIVGGGFVSGIEFHPAEKNLRYCRTDMGGAYRWNEPEKRWEPLLDWLSYEDLNLMGVESIGLDPSDPECLYLSCGTYTMPQVPNGAILRSYDRGITFHRTDMPFKMGANENGRGNGERIAVDPNDGNILYLGTRNDGLWKSIDKGKSWNQVTSFPDIREEVPDSLTPDEKRAWFWMHKGAGIIIVLFDPAIGTPGKGSNIIYIVVSLKGRDNLFYTKDGGITWEPVPGHPKEFRPTDAVLAPDGMLYLTYGTNPGPGRMYDGAVWKFNTHRGEWTEITPEKPEPERNKTFGYAAVSIDRQNPGVLMVSTYHRYEVDNGEEIFRSTDEGNSWRGIFNRGSRFNYSAAPYIKNTGVHWMFDVEIDPFNSDHALFTTGYGGHETFNLTDIDTNDFIIWQIMSTGIEETVALDLLSPPEGAHLISAIGDYGGFVHWDMDRPEPEGNFTNPHFGNTDGIACAEMNPEMIVRVGEATNHNERPVNIGYSLDGGKNWQPVESMPKPDCHHGSIAVSADGNTWIWTPRDDTPYVTYDKGKIWDSCLNIPMNTRIIADKVNPELFYGIKLFEGKLYKSSDKGKTFQEMALNLPGGTPKSRDNRGDWRGGQDRLYSTPCHEGDLWLAAFDGLYLSVDYGETFERLKGIEELHGFGFGKAAPGKEYPASYLIGVVQGVRGIFRSDDIAKSWVRINDNDHQWGLLLHITGDPKKYGRVYVGTHGRGIIYGDPITGNNEEQ